MRAAVTLRSQCRRHRAVRPPYSIPLVPLLLKLLINRDNLPSKLYKQVAEECITLQIGEHPGLSGTSLQSTSSRMRPLERLPLWE